MKISILNSPDKDFNYWLELATEFTMEFLVSKRILRSVTITIKFLDTKDEDLGYSSIDKYNSLKMPRGFLIEINPGLGARGIISTLVHELIHVSQFIDGKIDEDLNSWHGFFISDDMEYWDQPWEIDAYGRTPGILTRFVRKHQLWNVFADIRNPSTPREPKPIRWK